MAELTENERKNIECWTALRSYLDKIFSDKKLEKLIFNGRIDIELFRADDAEINANGAKATVVYGINGIGAYRRVENKSLFQKQFFYEWGHFNSSFALAFALADDSRSTLTPEDLETRLGPYKQKAAGSAEPVSLEEHK